MRRLTPRGVRRSAFVSWVAWLASFLTTLIVFPVMIARIGTQSFGLWAGLTAPTGMGGLFGLGIAPAIVSVLGRSLGQARAGTKDTEVSKHLNQAGSCARAGLMLSLVTGLGAVLVGFAIARPIVELIHVPAAESTAAIFLFRASSLCLGGMLVGGGITAVLDAVGRVDLDAATSGVVTVANALMMLVAVLVRPDFRTLALVSIATAATNVAAPAVCLVGSGASVLLRWGGFNRDAFKRLGGLATSLGAVDVIGAVLDPMVKWSVGAIGGGAPIAAYELAQRAVSVLSGSLSSLLAPLMPYYARTLTERGSKHVTERVTSSSRALVAVALPTIVLFAVASNAVMRLWLGSRLPAGAVGSLEILGISTLVSIWLRASWAALMAAGQGTRLLVVQAVSIIGTSVALALAGWHVVPLTLAAAIAFCGFALAGTPLTLVQYGRTFGKAAAHDLLRSAQYGLVLAGLVTPPVLAVRLGDADPIVEISVAAIAWLAVFTHLVRREPQLRSFIPELRREFRRRRNETP